MHETNRPENDSTAKKRPEVSERTGHPVFVAAAAVDARRTQLEGQTWPEVFQIVQRESGYQISVPRVPSGTVTMRLETLDSWERVLAIIAETKDLTVTRNSETSFTLNSK